jgi:hypothetical protein
MSACCRVVLTYLVSLPKVIQVRASAPPKRTRKERFQDGFLQYLNELTEMESHDAREYHSA